jgi:hypothetical protein
VTRAFCEGESAFCIDFTGDCSTFDKQFSTCYSYPQGKKNDISKRIASVV